MRAINLHRDDALGIKERQLGGKNNNLKNNNQRMYNGVRNAS